MKSKTFAPKLAIGLCAATLLFCGCFDDSSVNSTNSDEYSSASSSDSSGDGAVNAKDDQAEVTNNYNGIPGYVYDSEAVSINTSNQTIVTRREYNCVKNPDGSIVWQYPATIVYTRPFAYTIQNDTLLRYYPKPEEVDFKFVYTGNTSGDIFGSWEDTGCKYDGGILNCEDKKTIRPESYRKQHYVTLTADSIYYSYILQDRFNYMQTEFVSDLYSILVNEFHNRSGNSDNYKISVKNITDHKSELSNSDKITVIESDRMSQTFVFNGQTFNIKVKQVEYKKNYSVDISSHEKTCNVHLHKGNVTKDLCKAENEDILLFEKNDHHDESLETELYHAEEFNDSNTDEFIKCVISLIS